MKILFINTFYAPHNVGGAENSLRIIVEAMKNRGHEVIVLATSDQPGLSKELVNDVTVYRGGIHNEYWIYDSKIKHSFDKRAKWLLRDIYNKDMSEYVREVIELEKPDIVSSHNVRGWSISIWDEIKKTNTPLVQVLHDFYSLCRRGALFNNGQACEKRCIGCQVIKSLNKVKSQKIDAVVGVCKDILDRHVNEGYFSKSVKSAIHNVRTIPDRPLQFRNSHDPFVFGYIGSLTDNKGVLWLIEQFKKVKSKNIYLRIAGKGDIQYETLLKTTAESDSRISFLGHTNSNEFYSQVNALIIPSIWYEPLASVAIEACANHIPVITSGMGGLKEVIFDNINGLICDYSERDSLSNAIFKLSSDETLYMKLQGSARKSITSFLDQDRLVNQYESVYSQLNKKV